MKQLKQTLTLKDDLILKQTSITDNLANQIKQKDQANSELRDRTVKLQDEVTWLRKELEKA